MTLCTDAGLADPVAQVYMLFYYLGPAMVILPLLLCKNNNTVEECWPSRTIIFKAVGIALFDIVATSMNYAGGSLAGPTIFAIVYSSVTVWTAVFSQVFLKRSMNAWQWVGVWTVFGGLALTATDSLQLGDAVVKGLVLLVFGSAMHAMTYIMCEAIMTMGDEKLSIQQNCAIQANVACFLFFVWQLVYTIPRWDDVLSKPMQAADTGIWTGVTILSLFALANLIHSIAFYQTLLHFPGGATSAGVMKGLQAVLVFAVTHLAFCGRTGGEEMCFTRAKLVSLIIVVGGVVWYGVATQNSDKIGGLRRKGQLEGYERIGDHQSGIEILEPVP
jgi:drug/metabolite transporter (DMT)-like permease